MFLSSPYVQETKTPNNSHVLRLKNFSLADLFLCDLSETWRHIAIFSAASSHHFLETAQRREAFQKRAVEPDDLERDLRNTDSFITPSFRDILSYERLKPQPCTCRKGVIHKFYRSASFKRRKLRKITEVFYTVV